MDGLGILLVSEFGRERGERRAPRDSSAAEDILKRFEARPVLFDEELAELQTVRTFLIDAILAECGVNGNVTLKQPLGPILERVMAIVARVM